MPLTAGIVLQFYGLLLDPFLSLLDLQEIIVLYTASTIWL